MHQATVDSNEDVLPTDELGDHVGADDCACHRRGYGGGGGGGGAVSRYHKAVSGKWYTVPPMELLSSEVLGLAGIGQYTAGISVSPLKGWHTIIAPHNAVDSMIISVTTGTFAF